MIYSLYGHKYNKLYYICKHTKYNNKTMKYIIRAVKYFFYFSLTCAVIVTALVLIGAVEGNIDSIFEEGYRSVGKIAAFFAIVAALYPKLGFITREIAVDKPWEDIKEQVLGFMTERRYELESESPEKVTFRIKGLAGKISKMYEDRLTLTRTAEGCRSRDSERTPSGLQDRWSSALLLRIKHLGRLVKRFVEVFSKITFDRFAKKFIHADLFFFAFCKCILANMPSMEVKRPGTVAQRCDADRVQPA